MRKRRGRSVPVRRTGLPDTGGVRRADRQQAPSQSPSRVEPEFLTVGYATAAHGLNGELKVEPTTDFPDRFAAGEQLWVKGQPLKIESCRQQGSRLLLKLDSIDSREAAKELQGQVLEIPISKAQPLPPGQYYVFQIIGLEVHTTAGEYLGQVAEVMPVAGSDVYLVRGPRGELLIPAIGDVVKHIDLEHGRMTVEPIEGLL